MYSIWWKPCESFTRDALHRELVFPCTVRVFYPVGLRDNTTLGASWEYIALIELHCCTVITGRRDGVPSSTSQSVQIVRSLGVRGNLSNNLRSDETERAWILAFCSRRTAMPKCYKLLSLQHEHLETHIGVPFINSIPILKILTSRDSSGYTGNSEIMVESRWMVVRRSNDLAGKLLKVLTFAFIHPECVWITVVAENTVLIMSIVGRWLNTSEKQALLSNMLWQILKPTIMWTCSQKTHECER